MNNWIPVAQQLPPLGERFDAWTNRNERLANCGAYVGHWDEEFRRECMLLKGITHWMPIPKAPNEEKQ